MLPGYLYSSFHVSPCQDQLRLSLVQVPFLEELASRGSDRSAAAGGPRLPLVLSPVACLEFCSARCCVGEAMKFFSLHAGV